MIPTTVIGPDVAPEFVWLTIPVYVGGFIAVAMVVGAIRESARAPELAFPDPASRPSTPRMVLAGIVGVVCIAATVVGATLLMSTMLSGEYGPEGAGSSYTFAIAVLAASIASSILAWVAGRAILRRRPRRSFAPVPTEVGA
jgi:biotin transporter BioY